MLIKLEQMGYDQELMGDISMDSINENYSKMQHHTTPKGEKFLQDNSKMKNKRIRSKML